MNRLTPMAKPLSLLIPLAPLAVSMTALAQESTSGLALEEVVVTAQKRAESVQDIPVAISAFTAESLENRKMETANDIAAGVPNLQVSSPYGETQPIFSIRGQSMSDYNTNQASPVGVYVDEAYIGTNYLQGMALFDLERVEVLRGPQGTLYGKNTTGGAINFITRAPSLEGTSGKVTLTVGDYGREHIDAAAETVLVEDTLGIRAAYTYTKTDGHHDNHFPGGDDLTSIDTWAGRISLRYSGEQVDAVLRYAAGESDGMTTAVINEGRVPTGDGFSDAVGSLIGQFPREDGWDQWEGSHNKSEPYSTDFQSTTLTVNWDLQDYTLTSITSYLEGTGLNRADTDGAGWQLLQIDWGADVTQFAQDLRIASQFDGPFNFIAGVYYATDTMDIKNVFEMFHATGDLGIPFDLMNNFITNPTPNAATTGFTSIQTYTQERDSIAVYLHTTYDLTDQLSLTAGLRYTEDEGNGKDLHTQLADYDRNPVLDLITPATFDADAASYDDSEFTGKLSLDYQYTEDTLLYASYSRGYRSSAFNGGAQFAPNEVGVAAPEFVDAYELGFKTLVRDGTVQINGAAFYYDYTDQQFVNVIGVQQFLQNGEDSFIQGLELEVIARLTHNLTLNLGLGYLDTEFESLTLSDTLNGGTIDLSGNELFNAPELNLNLAIDYILADNDYGVFRISADTAYTAEQWFSAYNDDLNYDEIKGEAGWMSNAKVSWDSADDRMTVALWIKNIGDNDDPTYAINLQGGFGYDYYTVGLPRRMGLDLSYRF
ncbi:TonB-dependent receptor [Pseudomaricurvus alkylphenolicus]|uniref:TonB-dependent receptor n=1 Tax=Pseudomaricurvus alkylphenolicus TaxID=1306991 RepID=UPI001420FD34|nr:TonB-dependent receptor [Pseudomaricurvus alkylphenolicus]NIB41610.1 TonB-dependent receptor [Pseudomaricurvus alkylphenolicus]